MKKHLSLIIAICISLVSFAAIKPMAWDKPLQSHNSKVFENVVINWVDPTWYPANYWHSGQAAGYFIYIDMTGVQEGTWELSIDIETTIGNVTAMKTFVFTVPPNPPYMFHAYVLEMSSQMVSGETIADSPPTTINHWWIVS